MEGPGGDAGAFSLPATPNPLERRPCSEYDDYVTFIVKHGAENEPFEQPADSVGAAARIAVAFVREKRKAVRVCLPDGTLMAFEAFQEAVFQGDLRD